MRALLTLMLLAGAAAAACGGEATGEQRLTRARAHELALLNAPNITIAQLAVLEAQESITIARAAYLPSITGVATLARASQDNTRLAAGMLNNPSVYDREAVGLTATQLITDFGRTTGTLDAVRMHAWAEGKHSQAEIERIMLEVDLLYYRTLQSQARVVVAQQTVANRTLVAERVAGLAANKLKSELDLSFARVNLEEGRMLLAQVDNELTIDRLGFAALLGFAGPQPFQLVDQPVIPPTSEPAAQLVARAFASNPAISRLHFELSSALRAADAASALDYPTISAVGAAGWIFDHDPRLANSYAAGAFNLSIPLYSGSAIASQRHLAELRIGMARAALRAAEDELAKEVRVALASSGYTYARLDMAGKLLAQALLSYDLAKSRFDLGLTSIVDLNQADLNRTAAAMTESTARQDYQIQAAILANRLGILAVPDSGTTPAAGR